MNYKRTICFTLLLINHTLPTLAMQQRHPQSSTQKIKVQKEPAPATLSMDRDLQKQEYTREEKLFLTCCYTSIILCGTCICYIAHNSPCNQQS